MKIQNQGMVSSCTYYYYFSSVFSMKSHPFEARGTVLSEETQGVCICFANKIDFPALFHDITKDIKFNSYVHPLDQKNVCQKRVSPSYKMSD